MGHMLRKAVASGFVDAKIVQERWPPLVHPDVTVPSKFPPSNICYYTLTDAGRQWLAEN
jgi:hypothetical protein